MTDKPNPTPSAITLSRLLHMAALDRYLITQQLMEYLKNGD